MRVTDLMLTSTPGFIATYIAPLAFVISITVGKEAYDDYKRNLRDREANGQKYLVVDPPSPQSSTSARTTVLADMVLLWTSDPSGTCFVRTDQLYGETDWRMRLSVGEMQSLGENGVAALGASHEGIGEAEIYADAPTKDIHTFIGTSSTQAGAGGGAIVSPLMAENVLWANTVLASSGIVIGFVVYTGAETRAVMSTSKAGTKVGLLEVEVNGLAKILCTTTFILSVVLVALNGFRGGVFTTHTLVSVLRFLILFSSIIPISLRVSLDLGKSLYSHRIMTDSTIPNTIVRTSTLPEELGRVEYLLSDKTGTLTRNEMEMRKLHMGTMSYGQDSMNEMGRQLALAFALSNTGRGRRDMSSRVKDVIQSLALCHNVTPATNDDGSVTYQASSPDEVAIVSWTQSIGLTLAYRDRTKMVLRAGDFSSSQSQTTSENLLTFDILSLFPFTSESKRMGIIVRDCAAGEISFLLKGADVVMARIVQRND
ncbi:hypothetical protein EV360DRAFT_97566 [Lentinula raphanica]|nr:hypothetical protein EV360DRAFT_97566 [Lentinula raphanica]